MTPNTPPPKDSNRLSNHIPQYPPVWTKNYETPHDFQERHSPTEKTYITPPNSKKAEPCTRRILDSRIWDALTEPQKTAANIIYASFELMSKGVGYAQSNWEKLPGSKSTTNLSDKQAAIMNTYIEWTQECQKRRISHAMILDLLCFGKSCRTIDKDRRVRKGTARQNLTDGLDLFCEIKGWR